MADENAFEEFIRAQARKLREGDSPPKSREEWEKRRRNLREQIQAAIGPAPDKPCDLEPRILGTLQRDGYTIENLVFQSRADVWVTASAYVPKLANGANAPAVLVVHGHWAWARRDPVVQARCLGLVKLGFFVLAVDAFGAGERYTNPARGTYHGALYGATLWPTGHTLLGMQVYDNRRAVDYLLTRKEVNGKIGITGASGGGNQSMNAGAMDDRLLAVVPVCSVGNYQSYLQAACCVCEVLPGALKFTEEGDVLGLVAPRALLVLNATRDGIQFSPAEAQKSVARAKEIYTLLGEEKNVRHDIFESVHDYNRPMREAMYGWMTLHLKGEGKGEPIAEPAHTVEKPEDLACYPDPNDRPKGFLTPPLFAGKVGREMVANVDKLAPDHAEMWEATANGMRAALKTLLGDLPASEKGKLVLTEGRGRAGRTSELLSLDVENGSKLSGWIAYPNSDDDLRNVSRKLVVVSEGWAHTDGMQDVKGDSALMMITLRGLGDELRKSGAIAGARDHTIAEHGIWVGRSLLAHWVADAIASLSAFDKWGPQKPIVLGGIELPGLAALLAANFAPERLSAVVLVRPLVTYVTDAPYAAGTHMSILAPGILKVGDIPHLAALIAPRRLVIAGGVTPQGTKLSQKVLEDAFSFTAKVYEAMKVPEKLTIVAEPDWKKIDL
jgi:dienelactone hydrolase